VIGPLAAILVVACSSASPTPAPPSPAPAAATAAGAPSAAVSAPPAASPAGAPAPAYGALPTLAPTASARLTPSPAPAIPSPATPPPATRPPAGAVAVSIANFAFSPATITITVGTRVTWTNHQAGVEHTVTADDGSFDSGTLASGGSFSHVFSKAGTYPYHCAIHPFMTGKVIVTG
jgi:plastocyanin